MEQLVQHQDDVCVCVFVWFFLFFSSLLRMMYTVTIPCTHSVLESLLP